MVQQIPEADVVTALAGLGSKRFAYALRNGTIGVYLGSTRLWRVKSKHTVSGIIPFDLNGDTVFELISGWSNGKVEARQAATGDVIARDNLGSGVAGLLTGQLRDTEGELELLAVSGEGQVRDVVLPLNAWLSPVLAVDDNCCTRVCRLQASPHQSVRAAIKICTIC